MWLIRSCGAGIPRKREIVSIHWLAAPIAAQIAL
jgi:hypothetical protein